MQPVTLLAIDCVTPELAVKALQVSRYGWTPAATLLLSHRCPAQLPDAVQFVPIACLQSLDAYNLFTLRQLHQFVRTDYCLTVHTDGFLLNASCWQRSFFEYDYIGATWPPDAWNNHTGMVGNSGFCLRSRRCLEWTARLPGVLLSRHKQQHGKVVDDLCLCFDYREASAAALRIAPVAVAERFSREYPLPPDTLQTFHLDNVLGFHGKVTPITRACCDWLKQANIPGDLPCLPTIRSWCKGLRTTTRSRS